MDIPVSHSEQKTKQDRIPLILSGMKQGRSGCAERRISILEV